MRAVFSSLALSLLCSSLAFAQEASPTRSAEDFAKAIADAPCDNGQARGADGLCPTDEASSTRGFNLGSPPHRRTPRRGPPVASGPGGGPVRSSQPSASALADLRITFRTGSAEMTPEGRAEARSFAKALMMPALSRRRFEIAGHTDASGSPERNLALSQARAESVLNFLVANGVDSSRLEAKGYGSDDLARPDAPLDPANRRVEAKSLN